MLEQIHVLPNVSYLSKIRNSDVVMATASKEHEHDKNWDAIKNDPDQIYQKHL